MAWDGAGISVGVTSVDVAYVGVGIFLGLVEFGPNLVDGWQGVIHGGGGGGVKQRSCHA